MVVYRIWNSYPRFIKVCFTSSCALLLVAGILWVLFIPSFWGEDVRLHDGRSMRAYRMGFHWRVGEPGRHGQLVREWIFFQDEGRWYVWGGDLALVLLDFSDDVPYLAGMALTTNMCAHYTNATPFVFFQHAGSWRRIEARSLPDSLEVNLLLSAYSNAKWVYSVDDKRELDRSTKLDIYFNKPIKSVAYGS
jgi:hypothetical protein